MPNLTGDWVLLAAAGWYGAVNLVSAVVFVWDKRAAGRVGGRGGGCGGWRVREQTLLGLVWLGGFVGAWVAMRAARHKTRKWLFRLTPWVAGGVHVGVWVLRGSG